MRYGVSFRLEEPEKVTLAKQAGFDYVECSFQSIARGDDEKINAYKSALNENNILCEAANCFIPGDLRIIGEDFYRREMKEYIEKGMATGCELGLKTIAFGSGGARNLPDGFSFSEGFKQLGEFLREVVSPISFRYGVTVAIEPLRKAECNMIHTLDEGVMLSSVADRKNIACLADVFHMWYAGENFEDIRRMKGFIAHGHISNPETKIPGIKRAYPMNKDEFDYKGFVSALEDAGCERCSIEADCRDFTVEISEAGKVLCSL